MSFFFGGREGGEGEEGKGGNALKKRLAGRWPWTTCDVQHAASGRIRMTRAMETTLQETKTNCLPLIGFILRTPWWERPLEGTTCCHMDDTFLHKRMVTCGHKGSLFSCLVAGLARCGQRCEHGNGRPTEQWRVKSGSKPRGGNFGEVLTFSNFC